MTESAAFEARPAVFVSADWSKGTSKRSVHVADLHKRRIWREDSGWWDLARLLRLARQFDPAGGVLVGVDLALGVPDAYWRRAVEETRWQGSQSFIDWLRTLDPSSGFFEPVRSAADWRVDRPFFRVPKGQGALRSFQRLLPGGLLRRIDKATGAKPIFAVSGIPGTVGSATRSLWRELIPLLGEQRDFAVWPFEGSLQTLPSCHRIVFAETYPGLAYAAALADYLPTRRIIVSKTKREART